LGLAISDGEAVDDLSFVELGSSINAVDAEAEHA